MKNAGLHSRAKLSVHGCMVVLMVLWAMTFVSSASAAPQKPNNAVVFGPALLHPEETLFISGFNTTKETIKYRLVIVDGVTGTSFSDVGPIDVMVSSKTGFVNAFDAEPVDSLVVITIIGLVTGPSGEEVGRPAPPTPVSAEIAMGDGCTRLLLPAIQSVQITEEPGSE